MPKVFFNGDANDEQAKGPTIDSGRNRLYAIRQDNPTEIISLMGHRMDDAPEYEESEGKTVSRYRFVNGRNREVAEQLSADYVMSITNTLLMPNYRTSILDLIARIQADCKYDLAIVPEECVDGCDEWFSIGEDMVIGAKKATNTLIGYGDNEAAVNYSRTVKTTGELVEYDGMQITQIAAATNGLYAVYVHDEDCTDCGCPYQTIVRGGAGTAAAEPDLEYSTDGGASWTTIDTTAIPVDQIITDIAYTNGYLVVSHSDVVGAIGTVGGVAYALGIGTAMTASTLNTASLGLQTLEVANGRVYAFGTGGETYESCDSGVSFTKKLGGTATITFIDSSYDKDLGIVYLSGLAEAWIYDFTNWTNISADLQAGGPTAATDLESVEVLRPGGGVMFGGADGNYYECWNFVGLGNGTWVVGSHAASVNAIAGDERGYRVLVGLTTDLQRRSLLTAQVWESFGTVTGNFTAIEAGKAFDGEGGAYFIGVTDDGSTIKIAKCHLCFESGC
jgi:hypothetical protein